MVGSNIEANRSTPLGIHIGETLEVLSEILRVYFLWEQVHTNVSSKPISSFTRNSFREQCNNIIVP